MKKTIMPLLILALCGSLWAQAKQPTPGSQGAYHAQKGPCPRQASTGYRMEMVPAEHNLVKMMTLKEPSTISIYQITDRQDRFMEFYNESIIKWLQDQQAKCHFSYEIYLVGSYLVVISATTEPPPWESIAGLQQHVAMVQVTRLPKPGN